MPISFAVYQMRHALEHDLITSIYTSINDPDAFCSGYVEQVNERYVLLAALTPWGYRDGWLLWRVENIHQVVTGTEYEIRLEQLVKLNEQEHAPLMQEHGQPEADLAHGLLDWAQREKRTVSILTAEETHTGRIVAMDDLQVSMEAFDFFGRVIHQPVIVLMRDVETVTVDTEEERMYDKLYASSETYDLKPELSQNNKE